MFSLHENTRVKLCRSAFVALCLVPTCAAATWCVAIHLPGYRAAHELAIAERLGCIVRLSRVSSPSPDLTLYEGLKLLDPQTREPLASMPLVEITHSATCITIRLPLPATVDGARLDWLLKTSHWQSRSDDAARDVVVHAGNVTLRTPGGDLTLANVTGGLTRGTEIERLSVNFRLATADASSASDAPTTPAELTIGRQTSPSGRTMVALTTGDVPLPWRLIAASWPPAARLGKAATFRGRIHATEQAGQWEMEVAGTLGHVDLERLLDTLPHKLTGEAVIELSEAKLAGGRVESAAGKLATGPGVISRSLLQSAIDNLHLEATRAVVLGRENRLPYRTLELAFKIDEAGLLMRGASLQAPGALLADDAQVLLRQPTEEYQPVVNLVRALVPQSAVQVPAAREASGLAAFLPVPPLIAPPGSEQPLPQAKAIRLAPPR